jgi:hypothetical protein
MVERDFITKWKKFDRPPSKTIYDVPSKCIKCGSESIIPIKWAPGFYHCGACGLEWRSHGHLE